MGRAFPRLVHYLPFISESAPLNPSVMADWRGQKVDFEADTVADLEGAMRDAVVKLGGAGAIAFPPLDASQTKLVTGSVSRAWRIGNALLQAKGTQDPIQVCQRLFLPLLAFCSPKKDMFLPSSCEIRKK